MSLFKTNGSLRPSSFFSTPSLADDFFNLNWPMAKFGNGNKDREWIPSANVKEGEKEFSIELSVPGYAKNDIHVEVDSNNVLHVTGERKEESMEENENYTRKEFSHGTFSRSFQLPETVKEEQIEAKCNDGVLTLALPKKETAILKTKKQEIKIS